MKSLVPPLNIILQQRTLIFPDYMTNTAIMENDKFEGILFQIVKKKRIRRVEKGKSNVIRKDKKNEEKEL